MGSQDRLREDVWVLSRECVGTAQNIYREKVGGGDICGFLFQRWCAGDAGLVGRSDPGTGSGWSGFYPARRSERNRLSVHRHSGYGARPIRGPEPLRHLELGRGAGAGDCMGPEGLSHPGGAGARLARSLCRGPPKRADAL